METGIGIQYIVKIVIECLFCIQLFKSCKGLQISPAEDRCRMPPPLKDYSKIHIAATSVTEDFFFSVLPGETDPDLFAGLPKFPDRKQSYLKRAPEATG